MHDLTGQEFLDHIEAHIEGVLATLKAKNKGYANDSNPFHNFLVASELEGILPEQALRGMMTKHVVSIYDMLRDPYRFTMPQWREKIGDNIAYLLILETMLSTVNEDVIPKETSPTS